MCSRASRRKKHRKQKIEVCSWLRQHSGSVKPQKAGRFERNGIVYWELTNGQHVHELTARRMGL
jgi:hypothetical protein